MFASTDHPHSQVMDEVGLTNLVQSVLGTFVQDMSADSLAVYSYSQDLREAVLVASTSDHPLEQIQGIVEQFCASGSLSSIVDGVHLPGLDVASAHFLLFKIEAEPIGAMLLLSRSKTVQKSRNLRLHYCFATIQGLLQNQYRSQREAILPTI